MLVGGGVGRAVEGVGRIGRVVVESVAGGMLLVGSERGGLEPAGDIDAGVVSEVMLHVVP